MKDITHDLEAIQAELELVENLLQTTTDIHHSFGKLTKGVKKMDTEAMHVLAHEFSRVYGQLLTLDQVLKEKVQMVKQDINLVVELDSTTDDEDTEA